MALFERAAGHSALKFFSPARIFGGDNLAIHTHILYNKGKRDVPAVSAEASAASASAAFGKG